MQGIAFQGLQPGLRVGPQCRERRGRAAAIPGRLEGPAMPHAAFAPRPLPCPDPRPPLRLVGADPPEPDPLARAVALLRDNERLLRDLAASRRHLADALHYGARPDANPHLAAARLDQLRARRSRTLGLLRANRLIARQLRLIP